MMQDVNINTAKAGGILEIFKYKFKYTLNKHEAFAKWEK